MSKKPFVSIVVASFNRDEIIRESLISLLNQNYPNDSFEIVFFDNNSTDKTNEIVKNLTNKYPNINIVIKNHNKNYGSSGTYKRAVNYLNNKWEYILKIDEDVILENNTLNELVKTADKAAVKGFVGGKILYFDNKKIIQAIGSFLRPYFSIAKGISVNEELTNHQIKNIKRIDGVNGCMTLISREIYEKVGWFDDNYFIYYDDHELMYKANIKGFMNYYNPNAIAYHATKTGSKLKYTNNIWLYYSIRGSFIFLRRNFNVSELNYYFFLISTNLKFLIGLIYLFSYSKNNKILNFKSYISGYIDGVLGIEGKKLENEKK